MKKLLILLWLGCALFIMTPATQAAGLVPCGGPTEEPCQTCDVVKLANGVIGWLVLILGVIAAIVIVMAGIKLVMSGGNQSSMQAAKSMMTNMIIGYVIVLGGWLLIDFGMKTLLDAGSFGVWNEIKCVTQPEAKWVGRFTASGANASAFSDGDATMYAAGIVADGDVRTMINSAAAMVGLDAYQTKIFTALISQESSMCRNKVGPPTPYGTAYGCGQMLLSTARGLDPSATQERLLNDDAYNITLSARYFKQQLNRYSGDIRKTLASYNGGDKANASSTVCPGQLSWECELNSGYAQTRNYVANIIRVAAKL